MIQNLLILDPERARLRALFLYHKKDFIEDPYVLVILVTIPEFKRTMSRQRPRNKNRQTPVLPHLLQC